ncbi:hypothetical protein [uncultured Methanomethylovorans sp.]|uniref:hypothetical protein n=1 Tax=uncultured Methanomethylovorans sp. TaxID=183759 RepID=UPI002AA8A041|nr:hypothetical protein [uncultured Methanomethylovorans sp.]
MSEIIEYVLGKRTAYTTKYVNGLTLGPGFRLAIFMLISLGTIVITPSSSFIGLITGNFVVFMGTLCIMKYAIDIEMQISYGTIIAMHIIHALIFLMISKMFIYGLIIAWIINAYVIFEIQRDPNALKTGGL